MTFNILLALRMTKALQFRIVFYENEYGQFIKATSCIFYRVGKPCSLVSNFPGKGGLLAEENGDISHSSSSPVLSCSYAFSGRAVVQYILHEVVFLNSSFFFPSVLGPDTHSSASVSTLNLFRDLDSNSI